MKFRNVLLITTVIALSAMAFGQTQKVESMKGKKMPSFSMVDTAGKKHTNASLKGKVVILDFWATWCGPCKAASPTMDALYKKYKKDGLVVIGASWTDKMAAVKKYKSDHGYSYPMTASNEKLVETLGIGGIPVFLFFDKNGTIKYVETSFDAKKTPALLEAHVKSLLGK